MAKSAIMNFQDLPICLTVADVQQILGISKSSALRLIREPDFPAIRIGERLGGRRVIIPRDKFVAWLENKAAVGLGQI
ncbi:MAG: helix-turn-helix domain-containing protein [Bacillota bacterium]|nr:helix-turn-helix domain-containing protein [Bacillota bacterium]